MSDDEFPKLRMTTKQIILLTWGLESITRSVKYHQKLDEVKGSEGYFSMLYKELDDLKNTLETFSTKWVDIENKHHDEDEEIDNP